MYTCVIAIIACYTISPHIKIATCACDIIQINHKTIILLHLSYIPIYILDKI